MRRRTPSCPQARVCQRTAPASSQGRGRAGDRRVGQNAVTPCANRAAIAKSRRLHQSASTPSIPDVDVDEPWHDDADRTSRDGCRARIPSPHPATPQPPIAVEDDGARAEQAVGGTTSAPVRKRMWMRISLRVDGQRIFRPSSGRLRVPRERSYGRLFQRLRSQRSSGAERR
jgi:hypothetical protein